MTDVFIRVSGATELDSASENNNWNLATHRDGTKLVILNDKEQQFRLEVFAHKESSFDKELYNVSLKSAEKIKSSKMISIGRRGVVLANLVLKETPVDLSINVNDVYEFCDDRILHFPLSWDAQPLTKSTFIHIELDVDTNCSLVRFDISSNKSKFMTMIFQEHKLATCTLDGSGFMKSLKFFENMKCERQ